MNQRFSEQYKKLNSEQRQAVDLIDGPVVVIAGPGTGKTSILTTRIANILLKTDTAPENILALTFTESGVHSMRKKLVELIGQSGYRVAIYTFHSFCNEIIKNFPQEFPKIIGAQHVTDVDQIATIEKIISETKLEILKPSGNPLYYIKPVLSFIKELKREDLSPEDYISQVRHFEEKLNASEDLRHEKGAYKGEIKAKYKPAFRKIESSKEFFEVYKKYQKALVENRLYDYEDMIMEVLRELRENKNLLLELQETYQYILADEHQDANRSQNLLLELLSGFHENPNLFVVGDENQAIFRFQGASIENFLYFKKKFPGAKVVQLRDNYRSVQNILDASFELINKNPSGPIERAKLKSYAGDKVAGKIEVKSYDSAKDEVYFVAQDIKTRIENGEKAEEIAVLFRDNRDAEQLARMFSHVGIPFAVHADSDIISDEYIQKLVYILKAVNDISDDSLMAPILFLDIFGLEHLDVFKVINFARSVRLQIVDLIRSRKLLEQSGVDKPESFVEFSRMIADLSVVAKNKNLLDSLQEIVSKTGFVVFLLSQPGSVDLLSLYDVLLNHASSLVERHKSFKLTDYLELLNKMSIHGLAVRSRGPISYPGRVNLMTAHKSKGLEFDTVYCIHLNDGRWGGRRSSSFFLPVDADLEKDADGNVSDERRLFYVALTRARKNIFITYARHDSSGREILPSQFIAEIDPKLIEIGEVQKNTKILVNDGSINTQNDRTILDRNYLQKVFLDQGLSVSALNNYLVCPWRFFFQNLVRLPKAEERHQLFGTAMHETLKYYFDSYKNDKDLKEKEVLEYFENRLRRKAISEEDFELFSTRGKQSLSGYLKQYKDTWPRNILNEFNISGVHFPFTFDGKSQDLTLRGQLDKVEFDAVGGVNVVDYKTGQPKSRKEIEGETKTSDGNYKRQLAFYKLLLGSHDQGKIQMKTGEIDFVEPNKQGKYKKEKFVVEEKEVDELKDVIAEVARGIMSLDFWDKTCDDEKCEFCELRKLLLERGLLAEQGD